MNAEPVDPLAGYPVIIVVPVQWGDQDAFGHVNNTVYLRWYESARVDYCLRLGLSDRNVAVGPILESISCNFRRQITFPDAVRVGTRVVRVGRTSMTMEHLVVLDSSGDVAADGSSVVVVFDYDQNRPVPVPPSVRDQLARLEGKSF